MRALEPHGPRASGWVDIDPDKIGRIARGAPIEAADMLDPENGTSCSEPSHPVVHAG